MSTCNGPGRAVRHPGSFSFCLARARLCKFVMAVPLVLLHLTFSCPLLQSCWAHLNEPRSGVSLHDLCTYASGREVRDAVWAFRSTMLFRNSAGAHYGTTIREVLLNNDLTAVMPVLDANLAHLFPNCFEVATPEQWARLSPEPPTCPGGTDRWVSGEIVGAFSKFWPTICGLQDFSILSPHTPAFFILDNMHVKKIGDIISNMPSGTSWQDNKTIFRREKLAGKLADSCRGCTICFPVNLSDSHWYGVVASSDTNGLRVWESLVLDNDAYVIRLRMVNTVKTFLRWIAEDFWNTQVHPLALCS